MAKGLFIKKSGAAVENKEWRYYGEEFTPTTVKDKALCYTVEKTDGSFSYFVRYTKSLIDPSQGEKITGNFMQVDVDIFSLYKGFLAEGQFAGFTEANKLIRQRGFA
jgi:hypothetical protein